MISMFRKSLLLWVDKRWTEVFGLCNCQNNKIILMMENLIIAIAQVYEVLLEYVF
jgi:hypothetical protein